MPHRSSAVVQDYSFHCSITTHIYSPALYHPVNSEMIRPKELSQSFFTDWYDQVHIPDVLKVDGIAAGRRYEIEETEDQRPYLAVYRIPKLEVIRTKIDFRSVSRHHHMLPGTGSIDSFAKFDARSHSQDL